MPTEPASPYRGRFAPSPTGDLHMGSLVAAVASYLEARRQGGKWLLRIEDLDPPREVPGSSGRIIRTLEQFGFEWDGEILFQSTRTDAYQAALQKLMASGTAFRCACSRSEIAETSVRTGSEGPIYPGTCRQGLPAGRGARSVRLRVGNARVCVDDRLHGRICQDLATDVGDFVIRRADGCYAYQLAVVVDDAWQGITDVVRGADLLLSTPRQVWLQQQLDLPLPGYLHIPLLLDGSGHKLSKQSSSQPVDPQHAGTGLYDALRLLRQFPPSALAKESLPEIWNWAVKHWQPQRLRGIHELSIPLTDPR